MRLAFLAGRCFRPLSQNSKKIVLKCYRITRDIPIVHCRYHSEREVILHHQLLKEAENFRLIKNILLRIQESNLLSPAYEAGMIIPFHPPATGTEGIEPPPMDLETITLPLR